MKNNYLKEMAESGYNPENIDVFHQVCLAYLADKFFPDKNIRILDIGAGQGHCLFPLKGKGYLNLWTADIDNFNKDLFEKNKIRFIQLDVEKQKFPVKDNFFDVILSFHLIEHLKDPTNFLSENYRILKKDRVFILVTPDWRKQYKIFWRDPTHVHPYDKESIGRILRCFNFSPFWIKSFGAFRGIGRTGLRKFIKPLMFTGYDPIAISRK